VLVTCKGMDATIAPDQVVRFIIETGHAPLSPATSTTINKAL
jgi:hypothetical protein